MKDFIELTSSLLGILLISLLIILPPAGWITHVLWIIEKLGSDNGATTEQIVLGAIGIFMAPVGVIHGAMIWFGAGMV